MLAFLSDLKSIELERPWLLLLALCAPLIYALMRRQTGRLIFSSLTLLPADVGADGWRAKLSSIPAALIALSALSLAVAAAGPRALREEIQAQLQEKRYESVSLMMVVDVSGSMAALDLSTDTQELTRLDVVRQTFIDFVQGDGHTLPGRPQDFIGLVSFAGYADSLSPLTFDHAHLIKRARGLSIVTERAEDGTAIGDGLGLAVERLRTAPTRSRVVVLLTDGENNAGTLAPQESAALAKELGVRVYTIGAGSTSGIAQARVPTDGGQTRLVSIRVGLDEALLQEVADLTGGQYFRAGDHQSLRQIYTEIDRLERTELKQTEALQVNDQDYTHHFEAFVALALVLMGGGWILGDTWLRRLP
jgi:Ca-activated chloride channel homolog